MLCIGYGEAEAGVVETSEARSLVAPSTASVMATPTRPAFGWPPSPQGGGIRKSSRCKCDPHHPAGFTPTRRNRPSGTMTMPVTDLRAAKNQLG
jgi:hypothetical protein